MNVVQYLTRTCNLSGRLKQLPFVLRHRVIVCAVITANCVNRSVRCRLTNVMGYPSEEKKIFFSINTNIKN